MAGKGEWMGERGGGVGVGGRGSGGEWWWLGERGMGTKGIIFPFL